MSFNIPQTSCSAECVIPSSLDRTVSSVNVVSVQRSAEGERETVESHSEPQSRCWTPGRRSEAGFCSSGVRDQCTLSSVLTVSVSSAQSRPIDGVSPKSLVPFHNRRLCEFCHAAKVKPKRSASSSAVCVDIYPGTTLNAVSLIVRQSLQNECKKSVINGSVLVGFNAFIFNFQHNICSFIMR